MMTLIVGEPGSWRDGPIFSEKLRGLGHKTVFFDYRYGVKKENFKLSLLKKIKIAPKILLMNMKILKIAKHCKPDLIFITKGEWLFPRTVKKLRNTGALIFNLFVDDPYNMNNSSMWHIKSIPFFDCYITWDKGLYPRLKKDGAKRLECMRFAYRPEVIHPVKLTENEKKEYGSDVGFIGAWNEEREKILLTVADLDLKIWGKKWETSGDTIRKKWTGKTADLPKVIGSTKININIMRDQKSGHNMRSIEIPVCGGFQLAERIPHHVKMFKEGKDIECFKDTDEMRKKILYYLKNEKKRKEIANNGSKKVKNETYINRVKQLIEIYEKIKKEKQSD